MKKLLWALLIVFSVVALASCSHEGLGNVGNGGNNNNSTSTFDPNNVTMLSAYSQAQMLGFEGTLDEFIEMISGKDGINGKSAYELYKEKFGYEGTEEQWLSDLTNGKLATDYHEHTFGEWVNYAGNASVYCESRLFYRICTECKVIEWKSGSYDNHDFEVVTTAPTCQAGGYDTKTCNICGKVEIVNETPIADHSWESEYSHDNSFHWYKCEHCDETNEYAEHTTDESGYCTVCEAPIGSTVGVIYEVSADATYAEVIGYTGTAKNIIIADTYESLPVTKIYEEAFKESTIKSVVIPDSVTSIGYAAFDNCSSLTSVVIPDSVTSIGDYTFYSCDSLTSVVIPDSITTIGEWVFCSCNSLTSILIPNSVIEIGRSAFQSCSSLTSVTINGSPNVGIGAFSSCNSALYSEYELGKYVGVADNPYAILVELTNKNLSTYTIHEDTRFIGGEVFQDCERLTNITIPDSVTSIGDSAFSSCSSLTSVVIPDSVTSIGYAAFDNCSSLTSVVIPDSVTSIATCAFSDCDSLTSVVIGDSVTSIGTCAFYYCGRLTSIKYRGTEEQWNAITKASNWNYGTGNYTITFNYDGE